MHTTVIKRFIAIVLAGVLALTAASLATAPTADALAGSQTADASSFVESISERTKQDLPCIGRGSRCDGPDLASANASTDASIALNAGDTTESDDDTAGDLFDQSFDCIGRGSSCFPGPTNPCALTCIPDDECIGRGSLQSCGPVNCIGRGSLHCPGDEMILMVGSVVVFVTE